MPVTKKTTTRKPAAKQAAAEKPVAKKATRKPTPPKKAIAKPAAPVKPVAEAAKTVSKQKLVRDSFTIPEHEYAGLATLKARLVRLHRPTKKSELLRAGLVALAGLDDVQLRLAVDRVPSLKTGRPKATKGAKKKS